MRYNHEYLAILIILVKLKYCKVFKKSIFKLLFAQNKKLILWNL